MSKKNTPHLLPMFNNIVLQTPEASICQSLFNEYTILVSTNNRYNKRAVPQLAQLNKFILKSFSVHWLRIAFKGKGYRLRKFKKYNKVTLNFGHSH